MKAQLLLDKRSGQILIQVTFAGPNVRVCSDITFGPSDLEWFTLGPVCLAIYVNWM